MNRAGIVNRTPDASEELASIAQELLNNVKQFRLEDALADS